jgi:DNA-binding response OmpR family regulator
MKENRQILLVEDDLYSAETLKFALEAKGHKVTLATNGRDALNMVNNEIPQLIILDIMMPKMDGYHFCRLLKFDARFKHIPVIIVSSKIQEADRKLGLACGGDEYITKPYDLNMLINTVEKYLDNSIEEMTYANV